MFNVRRVQIVEILNEATLYIVVLVQPLFLLEAENQEHAQKTKHDVGSALIYVLLANFTINIVSVVQSMLGSIGQECVQSQHSCWRSCSHRRDLSRRKFLIEKLSAEGDEASLAGLREYVQRQEAIEFCKEYHAERQWLLKHELPIDDLPEE